jgi:soluble lytic murein transglycosylase
LLIGIIAVLGAYAYTHQNTVKAQVLRVLYPVQYAQTIQDACDAFGVDPYLACAIIKCESGWDASAQSQAGAVGLMQVLPSTASFLVANGYINGRTYPVEDLATPETNIRYGVAYLAYLETVTGSDEEAIAAYNAGPSVAAEWAAAPSEFAEAISYPETKAYLARVSDTRAIYLELYPVGIAG